MFPETLTTASSWSITLASTPVAPVNDISPYPVELYSNSMLLAVSVELVLFTVNVVFAVALWKFLSPE